jgi:hypothetical protein
MPFAAWESSLTARYCCTLLLHEDPQQRNPWAEIAVDLGALGGTRTPSLLIRSQMLYPLSYERLCRNSLRHHAPRPYGADLLIRDLDSPGALQGHPADARQPAA